MESGRRASHCAKWRRRFSQRLLLQRPQEILADLANNLSAARRSSPSRPRRLAAGCAPGRAGHGYLRFADNGTCSASSRSPRNSSPELSDRSRPRPHTPLEQTLQEGVAARVFRGPERRAARQRVLVVVSGARHGDPGRDGRTPYKIKSGAIRAAYSSNAWTACAVGGLMFALGLSHIVVAGGSSAPGWAPSCSASPVADTDVSPQGGGSPTLLFGEGRRPDRQNRHRHTVLEVVFTSDKLKATSAEFEKQESRALEDRRRRSRPRAGAHLRNVGQ